MMKKTALPFSALQQKGSGMLLIMVIVIGGVIGYITFSQHVQVQADGKTEQVSVDLQNLAKQAAGNAISDGKAWFKTWLGGQSTMPTTCNSLGCSTVYSSTALSGGQKKQANFWSNSANVHSYSDSGSKCGTNSPQSVSCAYVIEQTSCDNTSGQVSYTITGYGAVNGSPGVGAANTLNMPPITVSATATYTVPSNNGTFYYPSNLCPYLNQWGQWGQSIAQSASFANSFVANSSAPGSTFTAGSGTITQIGLMSASDIFSGTLVVQVNGVQKSSTALYSSVGFNGMCNGYGGYFYQVTLTPAVSINYGDTVSFNVSNCGGCCGACYLGCATGTAYLSGNPNTVLFNAQGTLSTSNFCNGGVADSHLLSFN